jgi:hypothetical protein
MPLINKRRTLWMVVGICLFFGIALFARWRSPQVRMEPLDWTLDSGLLRASIALFNEGGNPLTGRLIISAGQDKPSINSGEPVNSVEIMASREIQVTLEPHANHVYEIVMGVPVNESPTKNPVKLTAVFRSSYFVSMSKEFKPATLPKMQEVAVDTAPISAEQISLPAKTAVKTTRWVYPFGGMKIDIVQTKPLQSQSNQYCRAEIQISKDGSALSHRLFPNIDPNGDTYGLFVPEKQPSSDYFVIVKRGDYDGRTLIIDKKGHLQDLPGGAFSVIPDKGLLFSDVIQDSNLGPIVFDLRSGAVIHEQLPFHYAHWYRERQTLFFTTFIQDQGGDEKEDRSVIHVYQPITGKVSDDVPAPGIWERAKMIDRGFNPADQNISCGTL